MNAVVLAAGNAKRFVGPTTKLLQPFGKHTVLGQVTKNLRSMGFSNITLVIKERGNDIEKTFGKTFSYTTQNSYGGLWGTAIALRSYLDKCWPSDKVFVTLGDLPLLTLPDLSDFIAHSVNRNFTFMTAAVQRDEFMWLHYDPNKQPQQVNKTPSGVGDVGCYIFNVNWLRKALEEIAPGHNGEYYISGLVEVAYQQGQPATEYRLDDWRHGLGINTLDDLEQAKKLAP